MMGPFVPDLISDQLNLVVALLLGIGFGYVLEQAGFSSSRRLAGLFYGYDFTVLRVFFTAAVTAMSGVLLLGYFGLLDTDVIYVNPTWLWPAVAGGAIMGVGFILGGYCPGTSVCAASNRRGVRSRLPGRAPGPRDGRGRTGVPDRGPRAASPDRRHPFAERLRRVRAARFPRDSDQGVLRQGSDRGVVATRREEGAGGRHRAPGTRGLPAARGGWATRTSPRSKAAFRPSRRRS